jgi:hypothetical protein
MDVKTTTSKTGTRSSIIYLDNQWSVRDLNVLLNSLDRLYSIFYYTEIMIHYYNKISSKFKITVVGKRGQTIVPKKEFRLKELYNYRLIYSIYLLNKEILDKVTMLLGGGFIQEFFDISREYIISSHMDTEIIDILIKAGDKVEEEQTVIKLSAMKTEFGLMAGKSGYIKEVHVSKGDIIRKDQPLITIELGEGSKLGIEDYLRSIVMEASKDELMIDSINYNSPGKIELSAGDAIKPICDLIKFLITSRQRLKKMNHENKRLEIENQILIVDKARKTVETLKSMGYSGEEIRKLLNIKTDSLMDINSLIEHDLLKKIE